MVNIVVKKLSEQLKTGDRPPVSNLKGSKRLLEGLAQTSLQMADYADQCSK